MLKDATIPSNKITAYLWPIIRDNISVEVDFDEFVNTYATHPTDLDEWPIIRFFSIWCN